MELYNLMENEVLNTIDSIQKEVEIKCQCEKCRLDIAAIALNNLSPKYVVTEKGYLYAKVNNMNYQFNTDVITAVTKAIEMVSENPKHD
ncbi:late competence development ComFB family protein [Tissierella carlieri]|uniref:Late competence development ComFB family protein n=1 Tax=Tissierella carlieri TaxID=689904 RepID=A0ABT1S584_9FIRM|nr:late competence development ComFB family protein [Tissierella carlieri]MCQ4921614.1 late competence development ComFB family protein [Tissierella carlieri]